MRVFEYKFVRFPNQIGLNFDKKVLELERQWNQLGEEGWMFCKEADGVCIFVREKEQTDG